ncbi:MAG: C10 family peptidase [Paludibacteraceae bacterium]|nr:C10 family peptidase [Paludibacteraceae bacterium]
MMRKFAYILTIIGFVSWATASARTIDEAAELALGFLHSETAPLKMQQATVRPLWRYTEKMPVCQEPALYVFNIGDNGFVMVSAIDGAEDILAYSYESTFNPDILPDNVRFWMQRYASRIETVNSNPECAQSARSDVSFTPIGPIVSCRWGQDYPFNILCPIDGSHGHSVTGCVATAASQVMYHHRHPQFGCGEHSYYSSSNLTTVYLSADFENTEYRWDLMKDYYYYSGGTPDASDSAVAQIMLHAGISCDMSYSYSASGAQEFQMMEALYTYFRYDKSIRLILTDYCDYNNALRLISYELSNDRPVYVVGYTKEREGHAFICDGIDERGLVHINWGWSGMSDGYFYLYNLDPNNQGIGGSSSELAFTEKVEIGVGIRPDEGGETAPTITSNKMFVSDTIFDLNKSVRIRTGSYLGNFGACHFDGKLALVLYCNGSFSKVLEAESYMLDRFEETNDPVGFNHVFAGDDLQEDSLYEVTISATNGYTYYPLHFEGKGICTARFTVVDGKIRMSKPEVADISLDTSASPVPTTDMPFISAEHSNNYDKIIVDGQLYIGRNGHWFNMLGQSVSQ